MHAGVRSRGDCASYTEFFIVACTRQPFFSPQPRACSPLLRRERFVINYGTGRKEGTVHSSFIDFRFVRDS